MIKADLYLRQTLFDIVMDGNLDFSPRAKYADGSPAHTKFVTQRVFSYDLDSNEFPIPTLRNTALKTGIKEILWIYQKQNSLLQTARELGVDWWDSWNIGNDTIGKRYGATVKEYNIIDNVLSELQHNKFSRRHIIDLYQYKDLQSTPGLHPCVFLSMFSVRNISGVNYVDLMLVSRSSDFITAGFINQTQYVSLLMMIVGHLNHETDELWKIGKFMFVVNDVHIYLRHLEASNELLHRIPLNVQPTMVLKENKNFYDYTVDDFEFTGLENIKKLENPLELAI